MVDPLTIIGTAASVVGIVEVLAKTVSKLHELRNRWKEADFTFINLIAQITALKAALNKIEEWMGAGLDDGQAPYHQLVIDLGVSVTCCRMLTDKMEAEVSEIHQNADNGLDSHIKLKYVGKNGTLAELQRLVEQQTSALTLLLTVCNCKAISDQKILLEKSSTRKIFRRVKDDTSSLYVQRDSGSLHSRISRYTDNLSKISKQFEFDLDLFVSKVYERALRGALKDTVENLRRRKAEDFQQLEGKKRTQVIDRAIRQDSKRLCTECNVLVLGDSDCRETFLKQTTIMDMGGFTTEDLREYKAVVRENIWSILGIMDGILDEFSTELELDMKESARLLAQELATSPTDETAISAVTAEAVQRIWRSEQFSMLLKSIDCPFPNSAGYFIESIKRITEEDYIPTTSDILRAKARRTGIQEYKLNIGSLTLRMFNIGGQRSETRKWIHQFEDVTNIVFFVDLGSYTEAYIDNLSENHLKTYVDYFESVVNSKWFLSSSVILFLSNVGVFRQKLACYPMRDYFPGYDGGYDIDKASRFVLELFKAAMRSHSNLYSYILEADDYSVPHHVYAAVQNTIKRKFEYSLGIRKKTTPAIEPGSNVNWEEGSIEVFKTADSGIVVGEQRSGNEVTGGAEERREEQMSAGQDIGLDNGTAVTEEITPSEIGVAL